MKINSFTLMLSFTAIFLGSANADEVTIPNEFQSNTPARASEVNENFSAVKSAVDDNDSRISINTNNISQNKAAILAFSGGLSVYANGLRIGYLMYANGEDQIRVLSSNGYFVSLEFGGEVFTRNGAYYEGLDCTGQAYTSEGRGSTNSYSVYGHVTLGNNNQLLYVPKGAIFMTDISVASGSFSGSSCSNNVGTTIDGFTMLLNDEAVTGVPDSGFAGPITFGP